MTLTDIPPARIPLSDISKAVSADGVDNLIFDLTSCPTVDYDFALDLRRWMEAELAESVQAIRGGDALPHGRKQLWLNKTKVTAALGCARKHQADLGVKRSWDLRGVQSSVTHNALRLATIMEDEQDPMQLVNNAVRSILDSGGGAAEYLASATSSELMTLQLEATQAVTAYLETFPKFTSADWPVTHKTVQADFGGGAIKVTARIDLMVGNSLEDRKVIINLKTGGPAPLHAEDLRFYALLETLRRTGAPRRVFTYYLSNGSASSEDISCDVLQAAAERVVAAVKRTLELNAGTATPETMPDDPCKWCRVQKDCGPGTLYLESIGYR